MKRTSFLCWPAGLVGAIILLSSGPGLAEDAPVTGDVLRVHVTIPPTPEPTAQDRVGDRLVDLFMETFRSLGFTGKVERLDELDEAPADGIVLWITLHEWERDRIGNVNCRFAATLEVRGAKRELNVFSGTSPGVLTAPGRFGISRAFDDAAETAARDLYDALAKTELIVGLRKR